MNLRLRLCMRDLGTHHLQVVPHALGEVAGHFSFPRLKHRCDEQGWPPQELAVHSPGAGILREPSQERQE